MGSGQRDHQVVPQWDVESCTTRQRATKRLASASRAEQTFAIGVRSIWSPGYSA